jgi:hypothetical protein
MLPTEIAALLSLQAAIGPGEKAIVYQNRLWCDHVYTTTGDVGRWWMNTFVRPVHMDASLHIQWLVRMLESITTLTCSEHTLFDECISTFLKTITNLMGTYPHGPTHASLQDSLMRVLYVHSILPACIRREECETHV